MNLRHLNDRLTGLREEVTQYILGVVTTEESQTLLIEGSHNLPVCLMSLHSIEVDLPPDYEGNTEDLYAEDICVQLSRGLEKMYGDQLSTDDLLFIAEVIHNQVNPK